MRRQELAQALERAGCPVNLEGIDWHTAGTFELQPLQLGKENLRHFSELLVDISPEEMRILEAAFVSKRHQGSVMTSSTVTGIYIEAGEEVIIREEASPEDTAKYREAIEALSMRGLLRQEGKESYSFTSEAYKVARELFSPKENQ